MDGAPTGAKPKQPFLRRGEGVERRVHAPRTRTFRPQEADSAAGTPRDGVASELSPAWAKAPKGASKWDEEDGEPVCLLSHFVMLP